MLIDKGILDPDPDLAAFAPRTKKTMRPAGCDLHIKKTLWAELSKTVLRCAWKMYASFFLLGYRCLLHLDHLTSKMERDMSHLQSLKSQPRNRGFSLFFPCYRGEFRRMARNTLYVTPQFSSGLQAMVTPLCTSM